MVLPRQRLFQDLPDDSCRNCAGRGFLLFERVDLNNKVMPNEVIECGVCDGTGKRKTDKCE